MSCIFEVLASTTESPPNWLLVKFVRRHVWPTAVLPNQQSLL